jgi:hypothetical protein
MKEEVSRRTHSNKVAVRVFKFVEKGKTFFLADFVPSGGLDVVGRHKTAIEAQEEADQMMGNTGHRCSADCTSWTKVQKK